MFAKFAKAFSIIFLYLFLKVYYLPGNEYVVIKKCLKLNEKLYMVFFLD